MGERYEKRDFVQILTSTNRCPISSFVSFFFLLWKRSVWPWGAVLKRFSAQGSSGVIFAILFAAGYCLLTSVYLQGLLFQGNGRRYGTGKCTCDSGYVGNLCRQCAADHFEKSKTENSIECESMAWFSFLLHIFILWNSSQEISWQKDLFSSITFQEFFIVNCSLNSFFSVRSHAFLLS